MNLCLHCKQRPAAEALKFCADCLRSFSTTEFITSIHAPVRRKFALPETPPRSPHGIVCRLCANQCQMAPGETGYCGLRWNAGGYLKQRMEHNTALAYVYDDPLPTNCCAAWFCRGSCLQGYNLAVFFYGCSFNCLFCQNSSHKFIAQAPRISLEQMVSEALQPDIRCVCFFGGSPEPQLPFAIKAARKILEFSEGKIAICWEWNGSGHFALVREAARISQLSGGTVKFDLKAFHPNLARALCGVSNQAVLENFQRLYREFPQPEFITATTLLVPYYIEAAEVEALAKFIASLNPDIPYSLLIFHPDFYLRDLPITPRNQVTACYEAAKRHLHRVNVGNQHLLAYAPER